MFSRKNVNGRGAHGYYPTNFTMLYEAFALLPDKQNAKIFDFGCGKGANFIALREFGYSKIGGVEYTDKIYQILKKNLGVLGILYIENSINDNINVSIYLNNAIILRKN